MWKTAQTIAIVIAVLTALGIGYFAVKPHLDRDRATRTELASVKVENDVLTGNLANCRLTVAENERDQARTDAESEKTLRNLDKAPTPVSVRTRTASRTERQQRTDIITDFVADGILPASRITDTVYVPGPVQADSALVAAVSIKTFWANTYKRQRDSLARIASERGVINDNLRQQVAVCAEVKVKVNSDLDSHADERHFLGFGRKKSDRQLKKTVLSRFGK